ncbi:hypothetical protein RB595_007480 [Gaeumannomyces hyphopodioides]
MAPTQTPAAADASMCSVANAMKAPQKSQEVFSCTVRRPPYAYAQLRLDHPSSPAGAAGVIPLDLVLARSYCASALQQFLGVTGAAISVDVLRVDGEAGEFWVRVPQPDLGRFSAAVTAWPGASHFGSTTVLRILTCGDWLGSLLGRSEQQSLWAS